MSPGHWVQASLDEVCTLVTDGTHHSPPNGPDGEFMYVTAKNIRPWGLDLKDVTWVSASVHEGIHARCPVEFGDVLYIKDGVTTGLAAVNHLREPFSMLSSVALLKPRRGLLDPGYLKHWLNSPTTYSRMTGEMTGSAIQRLVLRQIRSAGIPLPPLREQQRIARILDDLLARGRKCCQRLERVLAILKRLRQSVLAAATSGELTREWREKRGLQLDWQETTLKEVATVGTGSTPPRSNKAFYATAGTPWVTSAATGRPYVDSACEYVTEAAIAVSRLKRYPVGTLLVAMYGEGKTRGQVTELRIEATVNQACAAIVANERRATRDYLKLALEARYLEMRALAEGGAQPNLNLSKIKELVLCLPPLEEQAAIVEVVDNLTALVQSCSVRLRAATSEASRLPEVILAKAFRGDLAPQDPSEEPASVMLEHLREQRAAVVDQARPRSRRRSSSRSEPHAGPMRAAPKRERAS